MDYASDDDLLVVTGGVHQNPTDQYDPTNYATTSSSSPQTDADFALSLQAQRAEMRLANQQASNIRHEMGVQNNTIRSVVPVPEGLPTAAKGTVSSATGQRRTSAAKAVDASRVAVLEEEVKGLTNQLQNQAKGLQRMSTEAEKQAKLIATLNARIDREVALNRDMQAKLKLAEAQSAAQKKEMQAMQREASGLTGVTADARLQKALEEIANLKANIATMSASAGSGSQTGGSQQTEQLIRDKKKLELQRVELLNCIRKQNKLIEVLRRQKLHLEAAKLLQMTEEDFTRVLEAH